MSYIESSLVPGEQIVHRGKVHPLVFLWPVIWTVLAVWIPSKMSSGEPAKEHMAGMWAFFFIVIAAVSWTRALSAWLGTEYGVTNKRVVLKRGIIMRKTAEMRIDKIEGFGINQGILGRIFSYGTIEIGGTGGDKNAFPFCSNPSEFRKQIAMQSDPKEKA